MTFSLIRLTIKAVMFNQRFKRDNTFSLHFHFCVLENGSVNEPTTYKLSQGLLWRSFQISHFKQRLWNAKLKVFAEAQNTWIIFPDTTATWRITPMNTSELGHDGSQDWKSGHVRKKWWQHADFQPWLSWWPHLTKVSWAWSMIMSIYYSRNSRIQEIENSFIFLTLLKLPSNLIKVIKIGLNSRTEQTENSFIFLTPLTWPSNFDQGNKNWYKV